MTIKDAVDAMTTPEHTARQRKFKKRADVQLFDDPRAELRRLVNQHKQWSQTARSWLQSVSDRTMTLPDGSTMDVLCTVPETIRSDTREAAGRLQRDCEHLKSSMGKALLQVPIYQEFLSKVYGFGPITCSYLVAMVKIDKAVKPSNLIRYCGNACDPKTGKREIRHAPPKEQGGEGTYNDELKMRIWQGMMAMRKCAARYKVTNKYLTRWDNAVFSRKTMDRALGADHAGRRKATDLVLEDLYVIWRTLEGLPVFPDLYSVRRGYHHGGKPCVNEGRVMTLEEAWSMVGDVGEWAV